MYKCLIIIKLIHIDFNWLLNMEFNFNRFYLNIIKVNYLHIKNFGEKINVQFIQLEFLNDEFQSWSIID